MVEFIGGWLCDQAMAGWDVHVLVPEVHDERPLRILGATTATLDQFSVVSAVPEAHIVALESSVIEEWQSRFGRVARATLHGHAGGAVLWGPHGSAAEELGLAGIVYRPTAAALAFKYQALRDARAPTTDIGNREILYATNAPRVDHFMMAGFTR